MPKPFVSVITVSFNADKYIEETIKSVIEQTYDNIEYIIIDGGSSDKTLEIIKKYEDKIDYYISEKDGGIYDAMNKGIEAAHGEWISFMNAGDIFFNKTVVEDIFLSNDFKGVDIVYGNHEVRYPNKKRVALAKEMKNIWQGSCFSHQSAFISSKFHKENRYNISNRIVADFEFFYKAYRSGAIFKHVDVLASSITSGGLSDIKRFDSIVARWNVVEKDTFVNLYYVWLILKESLKEIVKKVITKSNQR